MLHVIAYDITDDARRSGVARILLDYGERIQYSVFEADLDAASLSELVSRVSRMLDVEEDRLKIYRLCGACVGAIQNLGRSRSLTAPQRWVV